MNWTLRIAIVTFAALLVAVTNWVSAQGAQGYPSKPIQIIVPFAAGGTSDVLARAIGQKLTEMWGQQVVVDNRPGAGGNIGATAAAKAKPDGYTLLLLDVATITIAPSIFPNLQYDPVKDFAPVTMVAASPHALVVNPSVPAKSVKELIAYAKANPGKLNFASAGNGTAVHLAGEQFKLATGTDIRHVPYKGGAAAVTALVGGEVDMTLNGLLATLPQIKGGRIRALAVASSKRSEAMPDLPTVSEAGVPGFESGSWQGLLAPGGTPKEIVDKLNTAVVKILKTPEMKERLAGLGADVVADTPEQFAAFLREDTVKWAKVVKDANVKIE
jgi:tripartite-type tricarboxylate transporter receptor subunit TctC